MPESYKFFQNIEKEQNWYENGSWFEENAIIIQRSVHVYNR